MSDTSFLSNKPQSNPASVIDTLSVGLDVFIGETKITVGELNALKADSVITLDTTLSSLVEVRLNGIAIAQGELVAVGDNYGVRIVEVSQS